MHPPEAHNLYELAVGAKAAVSAAQAEDDIKQRAGLLIVANSLAGELVRVVREYCDAAEIDVDRPCIDHITARAVKRLAWDHIEAAEQWAKDAAERANVYSDHPSDQLAIEAFTEKMMAEGHLQMVRELVEQPSEPSSPA